jgi:tetratricopeptide (TPR) repeat protein
MGESYFQLKNYTASKAAFDKVLNNNWNDYSADAAKRVAQMQLAEKDYAGAKASYNRLLENNDEKSTASTYEGMMKISFEEEDYEGTKTWADMLSAVGTASPDAKLNAI